MKRKSNWQLYIQYLKEWAKNHKDEWYEGCSPACYEEFLDNDIEDYL